MNLNVPACIPDDGEPVRSRTASDGVTDGARLCDHRAGLTPYQEPERMTDDPIIAQLIAAHDARTLLVAAMERLLADGKHEAAEVVRAMVGEAEGILNPGEEHAIIADGPPNPAGRDP